MIEIRRKMPGSNRFIVEDFEDFMLNHTKKCVFVVRSQKEKDVLDGYGLIYGTEIPVVVGKHTLAPVSDDPYFFLWVVSVEELS